MATEVSLRVVQSGPLVSVQDAGRFGHMRYGVTESGAMDRVALEIANHALGRDKRSAAIEISLGGLTLECEQGSVSACLAGGSFVIELDGVVLPSWSVFTLSQGSRLQVKPGQWGSWGYLAIRGDLLTEEWLGSQSTHLASDLCGQPLMVGDLLGIVDASVVTIEPYGIIDADQLKPSHTMHVVRGPQDRFFEPDSLQQLFETDFAISAEYNRMGMRFNGVTLKINQSLDMPSEPIARGSLQVPGHGDPICLLADHQTTGGYPKIGTVISADQDMLAQLRVGDVVRFAEVTVQQATKIVRARRAEIELLKNVVSASGGGIDQRLWDSNLISGATDGSEW